MKCYLMNPHSIGFADKRYWKSGSTLDGISMVSLATGRNHMLGIGVVSANDVTDGRHSVS